MYLLIINLSLPSGIKELYCYIGTYNKEFDCIILARDKNLYRRLTKEGFSVVSGYKNDIFYSARSEFIILDATVAHYSYGNFSLIQLWHGSGFKKVGLLNRHSKLDYNRLKNHYKKYMLVCASSQLDKLKKERAFNSKNVKVLGCLKSDSLLNSGENDVNFMNLNVNLAKNIILYAPTYRESMPKQPFSNELWHKLNKWLESNDSLFLVNKHPWDSKLYIPNDFNNIIDVTYTELTIHNLLLNTNVLITDYSSISTEFSVLNRPIIFYQYDYQTYIKSCRSLFYDLTDILPGPIIKDEIEVLYKLKCLKWFDASAYKKDFVDFANNFQEYRDGKTVQRILNQIKEMH